MTGKTPNFSRQMSESQIKATLDAGIITPEQAGIMRDNLRREQEASQAVKPAANNPNNLSLNNSATIGHEDNMRFLRSFSDVFITIGLILFSFGTSGVAALLGGGVLYLGAAGIMWIGAEYFGRKKRAHLPSLILALAYLFFTQRGFAALFGGGGSLAALVTMGAMTLFYWRIRLPFCIALIAAAALFLLFSLLGQFVPDLTKDNLGFVLSAAGLTVFAAALAYDSQDEHRTTRFADNAFWLHFLAAPLIIHGIAIMGVALKRDTVLGVIPIISLDTGDAIVVLIIIGVLTLIGLAINRRALIVSALGYTGFAISSLFMSAGIGIGTSIILSMLSLGSIIVFLGVGWHKTREIILKALPAWRIFPPPFDANFKS